MNSAQLSSVVAQFAPLAIIFGLFWFLIIRPQQMKQKELKAQISAAKRGDRVITGGGIIGTVTKTRDGSNEIEVEIAPNVRVTVLRETLTGFVAPPAAAND